MLQGLRMPALGQTTDELRIISWLKKEGDVVEQGEPLFEVETDKVRLEVEAFASGILRKIVHQADEVVEVGTLVAYIGQADDELPARAVVPRVERVEHAGHAHEQRQADADVDRLDAEARLGAIFDRGVGGFGSPRRRGGVQLSGRAPGETKQL